MTITAHKAQNMFSDFFLSGLPLELVHCCIGSSYYLWIEPRPLREGHDCFKSYAENTVLIRDSEVCGEGVAWGCVECVMCEEW